MSNAELNCPRAVMPWERNNSLPEVNAWFVLWFKKRQINELITQDINELIVLSLKIILENHIFRDKVFFLPPIYFQVLVLF